MGGRALKITVDTILRAWLSTDRRVTRRRTGDLGGCAVRAIAIR